MPTLILSPRYTEDSQILWRSALSLGWKVERAHGWSVPAICAKDVVVYGEAMFVEHLVEQLGLILVRPDDNWLPSLPARWRGREVLPMDFSELRNLELPFFAKSPFAKLFPAGIFQSGSALLAQHQLTDDTKLLVQEIVEWECEYRCFVRNGEIEAISIYAQGGKLAQLDDGSWFFDEEEQAHAYAFCSRFIADPAVTIPVSVVVDVGKVKDRGWAVVECNATWASGVYGCDPIGVLKVIESSFLQPPSAES